MNKLQLFRLLRRHVKLSEKRSVVYEQNKVAKTIIYVMGAFAMVYMLFISVMLALIANDTESYTPYEFLFGLMPFFLVLDFFFRFIGQQTPAQLIKPYSLLPIPKYICVECFIFSSVTSTNNLIWLAITVPYAVMTLLFSEGLIASLGLIVAFQLFITINSLWYMLARTLINKSIKWWIVPIAVYGALFAPMYFGDFDTHYITSACCSSWLLLSR